MSGTRPNDSRFEEIARQAETDGWYKRPLDELDYCDWARQARWSEEVATALSFGLDPLGVQWDRLAALAEQYQSALKILRFRERVKLIAWDEIALPMLPDRFLEWAIAREYPVPAALVEAVERCGHSVTDLRKQCVDLKARCAELEAESQNLRSDSVKPAERRSLLAIVLGLAVTKFEFDGDKKKNNAPKAIAGAVSQAGFEVSDDTVRGYLKEAWQRRNELKTRSVE